MRLSVVRPAELSADEARAWHAMQEHNEELRNPFLSPEFTVAVGAVRPDVRVAVLEDETGPFGFFPFERGKYGAGRPVGAGLTDCQGLVHEPGAHWDARELLAGCGLASWKFDHLVSDQFAKYQAATAPSPMVGFRGGEGAYDEWLQSRSPRFRKELPRKIRKLEREVGPLKFVPDSAEPADLRTLMTWKSDQYQRTGRTDIFQQPWVIELAENLLACRENGFAGLLSMLYAGDQPVAATINLENSGVNAGWFATYDPALARYSPGLIHLTEVIKDVAGRASWLDLGKGDKNYKEQLKTGDLIVAEGTVTAGSALGAVHRLRAAAPQWAVRQIRSHKSAYTAADWALKRYGRLRTRLGGSGQPDGPADPANLCWCDARVGSARAGSGRGRARLANAVHRT